MSQLTRRQFLAVTAISTGIGIGGTVAGFEIDKHVTGAAGTGGDIESPTKLRDALFLRELSRWNGALHVLHHDDLSLEPDSGQAKDYLVKLTDGVRGSFADFPGSFLAFDSQIAAVRVRIPVWRHLETVSFQTVEIGGQAAPEVSLDVAGNRRPDQGLATTLRISCSIG